MKLSKKLATLVLSAALVFGTSVTAFAAPNDDVIAALKEAKVPATYITSAENYLKTVTLTDAQASAIKTQVTKVNSILDAANVTDVTKLTQADKDKVIAAVTEAGKSIGLTVTVTKTSNGALQIIAKDSTGAVVDTITTNAVKQTGANNMVLVAGAFVLVLAAGSVFAVRRTAAKAVTA
jgi:hypothetical protein